MGHTTPHCLLTRINAVLQETASRRKAAGPRARVEVPEGCVRRVSHPMQLHSIRPSLGMDSKGRDVHFEARAARGLGVDRRAGPFPPVITIA